MSTYTNANGQHQSLNVNSTVTTASQPSAPVSGNNNSNYNSSNNTNTTTSNTININNTNNIGNRGNNLAGNNGNIVPQGHPNSIDRRQPKQRFGWVRRLMQSPNKPSPQHTWNSTAESGSNSKPRRPHHNINSNKGQSSNIPNPDTTLSSHDTYYPSNSNGNSYNTNLDNRHLRVDANAESGSFVSLDSTSTSGSNGMAYRGLSDQVSDNISTIPLKSITSGQSTKAPSILSGNIHDESSIDASTAQTSLAPSNSTSNGASFTPIMNNNHHHNHNNTVVIVPPTSASTSQQLSPNIDRDSESIVTLASSSRRIRRRSIDTNCSTNGIPPASIMERLTVHPTTANSLYAVSIRTNDRASQVDASLYDSTDQTSSLRSEHNVIEV
ncbi:cell wall integrity and stress response component 2 [Scheffersomyces amazonensis]|uniref:cell wall integrity and stress response component 2 n=1 Tax=Scheffersomyces amazonensis TaxID=1078765 RepID=UPI00315D65F9